MDVRIGVIQAPKELELALGEDISQEEVREQVEEAVAAGDTLWLTDRKGRQVGVPTERLAYVEIGTHEAARRVGFGG